MRPRMGGCSRPIPRGRRIQLLPLDGEEEPLQGLGGFQAKDAGAFHPLNEPYRLGDEWRSLKQEFRKVKDYISKYRRYMLTGCTGFFVDCGLQ